MKYSGLAFGEDWQRSHAEEALTDVPESFPKRTPFLSGPKLITRAATASNAAMEPASARSQP